MTNETPGLTPFQRWLLVLIAAAIVAAGVLTVWIVHTVQPTPYERCISAGGEWDQLFNKCVQP